MYADGMPGCGSDGARWRAGMAKWGSGARLLPDIGRVLLYGPCERNLQSE
jgi:hypothetical protein